MAKLATRVTRIADGALASAKIVTAVDVLTGLGWLHGTHVENWRQGRADSLETLAAVDMPRLLDAVTILREWAQAKGLATGESSYVTTNRDRAPLRFTKSGDEAVEQAFRVHWLAADLTEARREKLTERQSKAPDLVVIAPTAEWSCAGCGDTGPFLVMEDGEPHCLTCTDMDHLVFLPAGNATLSRRAKKESGLSALVMQFNRRRKRYERQGILVEEGALAQAEDQCLADEDVRLRRRERDQVRRAAADVTYVAALAGEITRLFPRCSPARAEAIARHAGERSSGRVGRSAAAKALDEKVITLAVVASVRHEDTDYDALLMAGVPRPVARDRIRARIDEVLAGWR